MKTLSLAIIVKNEENNLPRLFKSVADVFDDIIVVDTGSTDRTRILALAHGARLFDFNWIDDFSAARNFSFSKVETDYVMWLDADDEISPNDREKLIKFKTFGLGSHDAYLMNYNYSQDEFGKCHVGILRHRIVRKGIATWYHPIHEHMRFPHGYSETLVDIEVIHRRSGQDIEKDRGRNIRLLRKAIVDFPDDLRIKFYFAKELHSEGLFEESLAAFEEYFKVSSQDWHDHKVWAHWYVATACLSLGREDDAVAACGKAIALDPRFAEFYVILGQIHYNNERWDKAIPWFEMATRCTPPSTAVPLIAENYSWAPYDRLCMCYGRVGQSRLAYEANEKAFSMNPSLDRINYNRNVLKDILFPGRHLERPIRLSIGSGGKPTPTYRNTDLYPASGVQEVFNQSDIPYLDATVHSIYSEHALEHSAGHDAAEKAIEEWARVMRHGGKLHLKVPDLEICCENFLRSEDRERNPDERFAPREWFKYTIYGIQRSQGSEPPEGQYHRTGFTKPQLKRLVEKNGFEVDQLTNYDGWGTPSIELVATQIRNEPSVRWLVRGCIDENHGSFRIRCLNVNRWLQSNGVDSAVLEYSDPSTVFQEARRADVVVMMGFGQQEFDFVQKLRRSGVSVIQDHCEDLESLPFQNECFGAASVITCCSSVLADKAVRYGRSLALFDAFEAGPETHSYAPHGFNGRLRVTWCGMGGNAENAHSIRHVIEGLGMELRIISEWDSLCYPPNLKWNKDTWLRDLEDSDIVISPQKHWCQPAKSNTKATQAMALGLPVLGSPLRSYYEAIKHGENGFISCTPEDWARDLSACRDQTVRERIGRQAKESVSNNYSIDAIGQKWKNLIHELCLENCGNFK